MKHTERQIDENQKMINALRIKQSEIIKNNGEYGYDRDEATFVTTLIIILEHNNIQLNILKDK